MEFASREVRLKPVGADTVNIPDLLYRPGQDTTGDVFRVATTRINTTTAAVRVRGDQQQQQHQDVTLTPGSEEAERGRPASGDLTPHKVSLGGER